jgi:hypothetical protein
VSLSDLARWDRWGIPSTWRSPTTRCPGGNIRCQPQAELARLAPGAARGSPRGGRRDAPPLSAPTQPARVRGRAIPEICPPGEGMSWFRRRRSHGDVTLAEITPIRASTSMSTAVQRCGPSRGVSWEVFSCTVSVFLSVIVRGSP